VARREAPGGVVGGHVFGGVRMKKFSIHEAHPGSKAWKIEEQYQKPIGKIILDLSARYSRRGILMILGIDKKQYRKYRPPELLLKNLEKTRNGSGKESFREYFDIDEALMLRDKKRLPYEVVASYYGISRRTLYTMRKRGEINFFHVGKTRGGRYETTKPKKWDLRARELGYRNAIELVRNMRMEKKAFSEISAETKIPVHALLAACPEEVKGIYVLTKDGLERKRKAFYEKTLPKIKLKIFEGKHAWQKGNKTCGREISIKNFNKAKKRLFKK
jgi:hypothetical protein